MNDRFLRSLGQIVAALLWISLGTSTGWAAPSPQPAEFQERDKWVNQRLVEGNPPVSFVYDGKTSADLLAKWPKKTATRKLDGGRIERTWTWTDPQTGLEVRCVSVEYADFPVVEWTGYFRNTGAAKTSLLEGIQAIDVRMKRAKEGEFVLRGVRGDDCSPSSYQPYE